MCLSLEIVDTFWSNTRSEKLKKAKEGNPRLGSVKLWLMLKRQLDETGCFPSRDTFIEMLRRNGLMVRIKRWHDYVTTNSNHNLRKYPNLVKGLAVTEPHCVWVSDITYVETWEGVLYLSLVTDLYSHKTEWLYHLEPLPEKQCPDTLGRIIAFYNDERPHMIVGYQIPSEAHQQSGQQKKCWKNPWDKLKETEKTLIFDPPNEKPLWIVLR